MFGLQWPPPKHDIGKPRMMALFILRDLPQGYAVVGEIPQYFYIPMFPWKRFV
jgi:hypothetical protein